MEFCKYQGAGNDFIIIDNMTGDLRDSEKMWLAADLCHRRFGVGADGLIAAEFSMTADVKMAFYNADGSVAGMCGNGIRCFAKFVTDHYIVEKDHFTVETGDGIKTVDIIERTAEVTRVKVDMGEYGDISVVKCASEDAGEASEYEIFSTHLGVPHAVIFCDTAGNGMKYLDAQAEKYGSLIEHDPVFSPDRTNVNFSEIVSQDHILCSTWERGAGKTLACGTGACSSALAAHLSKGCSDAVRVTMPGGEVIVSFDENRTVYMEGNATLTFTGKVAD